MSSKRVFEISYESVITLLIITQAPHISQLTS